MENTELQNFVDEFTTLDFQKKVIYEMRDNFHDKIMSMISNCHNNFSYDKKETNAINNYFDIEKFVFRDDIIIANNGKRLAKTPSRKIWQDVSNLLKSRIFKAIVYLNIKEINKENDEDLGRLLSKYLGNYSETYFDVDTIRKSLYYKSAKEKIGNTFFTVEKFKIVVE